MIQTVFGYSELSGEYDTLVVQGDAKATSSITVKGALDLQGRLDAKDIDASSIRTKGEIKAKQIHAGSTHVEGKAHADALNGDTLLGEGELHIESIDCTGSIQFTGFIDAKDISGKEALISGNLDAHTVQGQSSVAIELNGNVGSRITVLRSPDIKVSATRKRSSLKADTIEGGRISLENTQAENVRGDSVVIGPGCHIKNLSYTTSATVDPSSTVESSNQTGE